MSIYIHVPKARLPLRSILLTLPINCKWERTRQLLDLKLVHRFGFCNIFLHRSTYLGACWALVISEGLGSSWRFISTAPSHFENRLAAGRTPRVTLGRHAWCCEGLRQLGPPSCLCPRAGRCGTFGNSPTMHWLRKALIISMWIINVTAF